MKLSTPSPFLLHLAVSIAAVWGTIGAAQVAAETPAPVEPAAAEANLPAVAGVAPLDAEGQKRRIELVGLIRSKRLTAEDARKPGLGPVFLHMAASAEPPSIVGPALLALAEAYGPLGSKGPLPALNTAVRDVALARLAIPNDRLRQACLRVLMHYMATDLCDLTVFDKLAAYYREKDASAAQRFEALSAMTKLASPKLQQSPAYAEIVLHATTAAEVHVRLVALARLQGLHFHVGKAMPAAVKAKVEAAWRQALQAKEPEIRGAAAHGLLSFAESMVDNPKNFSALLASFCDDPLPSVRAAGVVGVGNLRMVAKAPMLIKLLDDAASAEVAYRGFQVLNGAPGAVKYPIYSIPSPPQVRNFAALAMVMFSGGELDFLTMPADSSDGTEAGDAAMVTKRVAAARVWYAANGAKIK